MSLTYKLWATIEVYDSETDEHENLDRESCEYKILETKYLKKLARYIIRRQATYGNHDDGVLLELEDALQRQGLMPKEPL